MATTPTFDESLAWLRLLRAPGIGAATLRALVERHGSAQTAVERAPGDESLPAAARAALRTPDRAAEAEARTRPQFAAPLPNGPWRRIPVPALKRAPSWPRLS